MRYLIGLVCVLVLGVVPLVGCTQDAPFPCETVAECPDDGNQCTHTLCIQFSDGGLCITSGVSGVSCTLADGSSGICDLDVCREDPCEGLVCDDGELCTEDSCDSSAGICVFAPVVCEDGDECAEDSCDPGSGMCDFTELAEDGAQCHGGFAFLGKCEAGICVEPCDWTGTYQCPIMGLEDYFCCPGSPGCEGRC